MDEKTNMTKPKHVLVAGGGIAGPVFALLLTRSGHRVTIVERAEQIRPTGQQIDISGTGQDVARFMGIEDELIRNSVRERGLRVVDAANRTLAEFSLAQTGGAVLTQEIEIMRSDMARVLYERAQAATTIEYIFGDYITALTEKESCITVAFNKGPERDFDLVVAADGLFSKTRDLVFGKAAAHMVDLKGCVALYTIPYEAADEDWCRAYTAQGGRSVNMRPRHGEVTGAYLIVRSEDSNRLGRLPVEQQKEEFQKMFAGVGWETERALRGMETTEDWYATSIAQLKMSRWSKGRVVLLGDAGYCPSPLTGKGTTLAYTGAYILAGCIATYPHYREALEHYEKDLRPFVDKLQALPPFVPDIALPMSEWGVWLLRNGFWVASLLFKSGLATLAGRIFRPFSWLFGGELELPTYAGLKGIDDVSG